jgi:hypothetical protein
MNIKEFGYEDTLYILDEEMENIIDNRDVKKLIDLIHFNSRHPENHNIRKGDMKNKYFKVYIGNQWKLETIDYISETIFSNCYNKMDTLWRQERHRQCDEDLLDKIILLTNQLPVLKKGVIKYIKMKIIHKMYKNNIVTLV